MISFASVNIKFEKSFFDFEKNDKHENFDDDEFSANTKLNANANANANASANANNLFDDMNEDENEIDSAKNSQKKKNAITKIVRDEQTKSDSKND